jgi:hypothetical protein
VTGAPDRLTRAGLRRLVALHPDGRRMAVRDLLIQPELAGALPLAALEQRLADYLLDPSGRPLVARSDEDAAALGDCLYLRPTAPRNLVAVGDEVVAVVAAPRLIDHDGLGERLLARRFAPRADDAVAAAVAALSSEAAGKAVVQLALRPGPDEDRLHLALLQAGRALAWRPELLGVDGVSELVAALLGLLVRERPRPLLDHLAVVLGALAASPTSAGRQVRETVVARFTEARERITARRTGASFLGELEALDRPRTLPDEDYYTTLPDRQVAEVGARILGRAAEHADRDGFVALQALVLDGELGNSLLPSFVDGLIAAAAIDPLGELVAHLVASPDLELRLLALQIASQLPLDACAEACLDCLEDGRAQVRIAATHAAVLLEPEVAVPALATRLDDPQPDVCAAAARALVMLGQHALIEARQMPGELAIGHTRERAAATRAALGDTSTDVVATLLPLAAEAVERAAEQEPTPALVTALGDVLRGSADGLRVAAEIIAEIPDALPLIAVALIGDDDVTAVVLPGDLRVELQRVLDPIIDAGEDRGMLALEMLSRFSLGDAPLLERIIDIGLRDEGYAGQILGSLALVKRRSPRVGAFLGPILRDREHLPAAVTAAVVAGFVLPEADPLWAEVSDLYGLGTLATAAAHTALVNRVRVRWED